jgi:putative Mn2+ efflux pump MntP
MFGLLAAAVALGASNGAAAIGIGLSGVDARSRARLAIVFGAFEAGMPLLGLVLGRHVANLIGRPAQVLGGALLVVIGLLEVGARRASPGAGGIGLGRLVVTGCALSLDNLVVGFALGSLHVNLVVAAATIGGVSVAMSLVGFELGARLGARFERRAQLAGGMVLVALGVVLAVGLV